METNKTNQTTTTTEQTTDQTAITINKENILSQLENLQREVNEIEKARHEIKSFWYNINIDLEAESNKLVNKRTIAEIHKLDEIDTKVGKMNDELLKLSLTIEQTKDIEAYENKIHTLACDIFKLKAKLMYIVDMTRPIPYHMHGQKREQIAREFLDLEICDM